MLVIDKHSLSTFAKHVRSSLAEGGVALGHMAAITAVAHGLGFTDANALLAIVRSGALIVRTDNGLYNLWGEAMLADSYDEIRQSGALVSLTEAPPRLVLAQFAKLVHAIRTAPKSPLHSLRAAHPAAPERALVLALAACATGGFSVRPRVDLDAPDFRPYLGPNYMPVAATPVSVEDGRVVVATHDDAGNKARASWREVVLDMPAMATRCAAYLSTQRGISMADEDAVALWHDAFRAAVVAWRPDLGPGSWEHDAILATVDAAWNGFANLDRSDYRIVRNTTEFLLASDVMQGLCREGMVHIGLPPGADAESLDFLIWTDRNPRLSEALRGEQLLRRMRRGEWPLDTPPSEAPVVITLRRTDDQPGLLLHTLVTAEREKQGLPPLHQVMTGQSSFMYVGRAAAAA